MTAFPSADHQRMYYLYRYLFTCLATTRKKDGSPNYKAISERLSDRNDFRKIVSELLKRTEAQGESPPIRWGTMHPPTTGDVVTMLAHLKQSLDTSYKAHDPKTSYTRILTQDDVLLVLYKLIELTPTEREQLGLASSDNLTLLQRALLALQHSGGVNNHQVVFRLYRSAMGLEDLDSGTLQHLEEVDAYIQEIVSQLLEYLPARLERMRNDGAPSGTDTIKTELTQKAQREIRRLLARSGNGGQPRTHINARNRDTANVDSYIQHYFDRAFVSKLAQTVVANERLTHQFPIYLKRVAIEPAGPLPFADKKLGILTTDRHYPDLLHPDLCWVEQNVMVPHEGGLPEPGDYELASQDATKVTLEFYVKVPSDYQASVQRVFHRLASQHGDRIDFSISSTGIGGALSHAVKIINTTLLHDIPCLQDYFSIAHDVTSTQDIIRDNVPSPVWAHNVIKLCRKHTVAEALAACQRDRISAYEDFAFAEPVGQGDYCGFDFFRAQSHAALQARLQAIRHTGVNPPEYLRDLCHHVEHHIALQDAWSYFKEYPFSTLAMVGSLESEVLMPLVGDRPLTLTDPYICFDAYLSIVEAFLDEGNYRLARSYLNKILVLNEVINRGLAIANLNHSSSASNHTIFSGQLQVRYLICWANYYYLYDTSDQDPTYLPPDCTADINREGLVQRAWTRLNEAQTLIQVRLRKYVIINEVSQATFHPHYYLLSRISFLRTKLLLFFSRSVLREDTLLTERFESGYRTRASAYWGQLYLAEKARLYAAADGNSEMYACYASMQCWLHLIAAYTDPADLRLVAALDSPQPQQRQLNPQECLEWAERLRDHALISYADVGQRCYYQIKEKSGLPHPTPTQFFGQHYIEGLPAIYEARGNNYDRLCRQVSVLGEKVWVWDMALLKVDPQNLPKLSPNHPKQTIYLFGTNACYLFFARGLYLLCSDRPTEFRQQKTEHHDGLQPNRPSNRPLRESRTRSTKHDSQSKPNHDLDLQQWVQKLRQATRLLDLAWAIAEEGCYVYGDPESGEQYPNLTITRTPRQGDCSNTYCSPEVASVRNLYPRRINDIADLGKVFSATCMVLQLYTISPEQHPELQQSIRLLLDKLYDAAHLTPLSRQILLGQSRYNGHLSNHLDRLKAIILDHVDHSLDMPTPVHASDMKGCRDRLLKRVFSTLLDR